MPRKPSPGAVCAASVLFLFGACSDSAGPISYAPLPDADGDGLPDALEVALRSDPQNADDPIVGGALDVDDGAGPGLDGIPDGLEQYLASTGSQEPITARTDSDIDGIPDYLEILSGLDHLDFTSPLENGAGDSDESNSSGPALDGISDAMEAYLVGRGTDFPVTVDSDTDGDGFTDFLEVRVGTDAFQDRSPLFHQVFDVDADGLPDHFELTLDSDPLSANFPVFEGDTDDDGGVNGPDGDALTDGVETFLERNGVPPPITTLTDSDADGIPDYVEILAGTNFLDPDDPIENGGADIDDETGPSDEISDALEAILLRGGAVGPVTTATDSDGDGIADYAELLSGSDAFSPTSPSIFDHFDLDADGVPDFIELLRLSDPQDGDDPVSEGGLDEDNQLGPPGDRLTDAMEFVIAQTVNGGAVTTFDDSDSDGISDYIEILLASDPLDTDSPLQDGDLDVTPETGPGGDGISDAVEALLISLGSVAPVGEANLTDADIIPDFVEILIGSNPMDGFDPNVRQVSDIDGDEAPDYFELMYGSDPLSPDIPVIGGADDTDRDGLSDAFEHLLCIALGPFQCTDPDLAPLDDADGDGLYDYLEVLAAADPLDATSPAPTGGSKDNDTNDATGPAGDGISDALEEFLFEGGASLPVTPESDTDGDTLPDLLEVNVVTDPFDATSPFADPTADHDGDGVSDALEFYLTTLGVPGEIDASTDTDGDGAPGYLEIQATSDIFDPDNPVVDGASDRDDDGLSAALEAVLERLAGGEFGSQSDTDGDGLPDYFEVQNASNPLLTDHPLPEGDRDKVEETGPADTITDALESVLIQLGAAAPVSHRTDSDSDGTPDYLEVLAFTDAFDETSPVENGHGDLDGDHIRNSTEVVLVRLGASAPVGLTSDTDGDGAQDYVEMLVRYNPVSGNDPVPFGGSTNFDANAETGPNGDGISDALELILIRQGAKAPVGAPSDTDGDGIPDYFEVSIGSNPFNPNAPFNGGDADTNDNTGPAGDGISDSLEMLIIFFANQFGIPLTQVTTTTDLDNDGVPDYVEINLATNFLDASDFPADGVEPEALRLAISGDLVQDSKLTGTFVYFDADDDFQGDSRVRWLRDDVEIAGANLPTYVLVAEDIGTTLTFEVTPVSLFAWPLTTLEGAAESIAVNIPVPAVAISLGGPGGVGRADGQSDLALWLRADVGIHAEGGNVVRWKDQSGHGIDAVAVGPRPVFGAGGNASPPPNGVRFEARNSLLFPRPVNGEFTVIAGFRTGSETGHPREEWAPALLGSVSEAGAFRDLHLGLNEGLARLSVTGRSLTGGNPLNDGRMHVLTAVRTVEELQLFTDGIGVAAETAALPIELSPSRLTLGSSTESSGYFEGEFFELILFDRVLNPLERQLVDHYLAGRWRGTLDEALFEHFDTHAADIAGIGRIDEFVQGDAQGTGAVRIANASSLDVGDFLLFGADAGGAGLSTEVPPGIAARLERTWAYTQTGAGDGVGTVDVWFYLGDASTGRSSQDFRLLIDEDGDFSNASASNSQASFDPHRALVRFLGVDLQGGRFFALGLFPSSK